MQKLGEYEIRGEIGRGGFGCVYMGFDPRVERLVAIKVLDEKADESLIARFRNEAAAAGNLRHRNIVTVYGYGEDQGRHFLVMEYLDGRDLNHYIETRDSLTLLQKVDIMAQVAEGLYSAHINGVVHRDIKPANIKVLSDGTAKIMDFGIARVMREGAFRVTRADQIVGTVAYMAPELFREGTMDLLGDIWAYGVIFYELLTGVNPFRVPEPAMVIYRVTNLTPEPICKLRPECPQSLEKILNRLLAKDRDVRYSSLDDVQYELAPVLKTLQQDLANSLLQDARNMVAEKRLEEANALARRIFDLDPTNPKAAELRAVIQEETRLKKIKPRIASLLRQAQTEAGQKDFAAAYRTIESARRLDPADTQIDALKATVHSAEEQAATVARMVRLASEQWEQEDLAGALHTIQQARELDPSNEDVLRILTQVRERMAAEKSSELPPLAGSEAQTARKKLEEEVQRSVSGEDLSAALDLLDRSLLQTPGVDALLQLRRDVLAKRSKSERDQRLLHASKLCDALPVSGDMSPAFALLDSLGEDLKSAPELEPRIRARIAVAELRNSMEKSIRSESWAAAQSQWESARQSYPGEACWIEYQEQIRRGRLKSVIEKALALDRLDEARGALDQAGAGQEAPGWMTPLVRAVERAEKRREAMNRLAAMEAGQDYAGAARLLNSFVNSGFDDAEIRAAQARVRQKLEQTERAAKLDEGKQHIAGLMGQRHFDLALSALRTLQKEFPQEHWIKKELAEAEFQARRTEEESARKHREALFAKARAAAADCEKEGRMADAIAAFQPVLAEFPQDALLRQEIAALEAKRTTLDKQKAAAEQRQRAFAAIQERDFVTAEKLLKPLIEESPKDQQISDAWALLITEKRNALWLVLYEQVAEIEDLFQKGKALKVKQKALEFLEQMEDPKVRGYLNWAQGELARNPPSDAELLVDKLRKWRPFK
jgi:predicted Ser/Thr protein kinase